LHAAPAFGDLWSVAWSTQGDGFTSASAALQCSPGSCAWSDGSSCLEQVNDNLRHLQAETVATENDPERLHQVILAAYDAGEEATVALVANAVDVPSGASERIGSLQLPGNDVEWPELAVLAPDTIAVAWIEIAADGIGREVHFSRYRICAPE
jgi:hypothetical protein